MSHLLQPYRRAVLGFALTVFVTALWLAAYEASSPAVSSSDFPNPIHALLFGLFLWGVLLNLLVSAGFALGLAPLLRYVPSLRSPLLTGITAGLVTQGLFVIGIPGGLGLPWSYGSFVTAFSVGLAVSFLGLLPVLIHRLTARGV